MLLWKEKCLPQYLFILYSLSLSLSCWQNVTPFTLYAVLVYFQMDYGLLLYFKLARVVMGNVSRKGENMRCSIT